MKIVGIDKNSFVAEKDGKEHDYYLLYGASRNANVCGVVVGTYDVKKAVLDNACAQLNLQDYKQLLNREFSYTYTYDNVKRRARIDLLNANK